MLDALMQIVPNAKRETAKVLIEQCASDFRSICGREDIPKDAEPVVVQMAAFRYSQAGADGLAVQSYSGMSETYLNDYPDRLKRAMYRYRRVKLL